MSIGAQVFWQLTINANKIGGVVAVIITAATKREKAATKDSEDNSDTNSIWTALTVRHTKIQI